MGTILGFSLGIITLGNVVGPPLAGWIFDTSGSYQGAWFTFIGLIFIGTIGVVTMPPIDASGQTVVKR